MWVTGLHNFDVVEAAVLQNVLLLCLQLLDCCTESTTFLLSGGNKQLHMLTGFYL